MKLQVLPLIGSSPTAFNCSLSAPPSIALFLSYFMQQHSKSPSSLQHHSTSSSLPCSSPSGKKICIFFIHKFPHLVLYREISLPPCRRCTSSSESKRSPELSASAYSTRSVYDFYFTQSLKSVSRASVSLFPNRGVVLHYFVPLLTDLFHSYLCLVQVYENTHSLKHIPGPDPNYGDICFFGAGRGASHLSEIFPAVDMEFSNGQRLQLSPENYLLGIQMLRVHIAWEFSKMKMIRQLFRRLDIASKQSVSLSAIHLQKLRLSLQLSTPLDNSFMPHQAILKFRHESKLEHVFVVVNSGPLRPDQ